MRLLPNKLRSRLLFLVGLAVIPAMIVIILSGLNQRQVLLDDAEHNAMHLAEVTASGLQQIVLRTKVMLSLLERIPQIHQADKCNSLFSDLRNHGSPYANIGLIRLDGTVACSALPYSSEISLEDRTYFKRAIASHGFSIGNFQVGRITHKQSINFAYPVSNPQGQTEGVLFAALPLEWIYNDLIKSDLPAGASASVIDPSDKLLFSIPEKAGEEVRPLTNTPLLKAIMASGGKGIAMIEDLDDISRINVFTKIPGLPRKQAFYINISLPISYIYAKADRVTERNLIILIVAAGLVFLIAWKSADVFILRQVRHLLRGTRELTAGELSTRVPIIPHGGELSELSTSFNYMARALEKRTRGVNRLNRIYAVLSNINGTILRVRNKNELLQEACRIAVEYGQFKLAWIGLVDEAKGHLKPVAYMGRHENIISDQPIPLRDDNENGACLATTAIEKKHDVVINDIDSDSMLTSWKKKFADTGFQSMASFPLKLDGEVIGAFSLYAGEIGFFDEQELRLLRELAADTSLGIEIISKEDHLYELAHFDSLTGLSNRHEFEGRIHLSIAQAQNQEKSVAMLVFGVDRLQQIRDELGHHVSDEALRAVAKHLNTSTGQEVTVARIGANEFGLALPDIDNSLQVVDIVEDILKGFPHVMNFQGDEFALNVHIGATLYPEDGEDVVQLVKNAELAMHHASVATMNRPLTFFSQDMEEQVREQRRIEQHLRHAIEKDELELVFQPVIDISNRMVMGCECLLRWHNDELGQVSPADFIPIVEQNGLIVPIGEWVMEKAFKQASDWKQRKLPPVRIVVNVSLKQLSQPDFVDRVRDIRQSAVSEDTELMLGIEITESQLMDNIEQALDKLQQLKAMGFTIYIDDFGTGYSSLSYLRQLPIDILKIDISFVRDLEQNPDAVSMAKGIIALAHSLDLRVIAEGVESSGQLSILEKLKCDYVQGYLFSRPGSAEQIESFFEKRF